MAIRTSAELKALILSVFTDNNAGDIIPDDARGFLDDAVDSLVPAHGGSAARNRLQWNATTGWTPVSEVSTQYLVVTRTDDFPTLESALVALLTLGGSEDAFPAIPAFVSSRLSSYASIGGDNTSGNDAQLSDLWPSGQLAPFVWLVTPKAFGWLDRSRVNVSTRVDNTNADPHLESMASFGRLPYLVDIDGTPFEVGRYRTSLARPVDAQATPDEAALRYQYRYAPPPPESPSVTKVTP